MPNTASKDPDYPAESSSGFVAGRANAVAGKNSIAKGYRSRGKSGLKRKVF
jgi:hypothetical protein